jgi:DNA-binding PadR family transcriptional regulator
MSTQKPLRPVEFQILLVLSDGDAHGYAIMLEAERRTGGEMRLEPGTLYRALRRLTDAGMITEVGHRPAPEVDDERRRYFALTDRGRAVAVAEAKRLARLVAEARTSRLLEHGDLP